MIGFDSGQQFAEQFADEFVEKFVENEVQQTILRLMATQPTISAKALSERVGMTPRGVQKNIDFLKKKGLVERVGPAKGGHWEVKLPERRS
jgi:ATP-dependent DNA helicase RecG